MGRCYNRLAQINGRRAVPGEEVQSWVHKPLSMTAGAIKGNSSFKTGNCGERERRDRVSVTAYTAFGWQTSSVSQVKYWVCR